MSTSPITKVGTAGGEMVLNLGTAPLRLPKAVIDPGAEYVEIDDHSTLQEKQDYYTYGASGFVFKQPPTLDRAVHESVHDIYGTDSWGDPVVRFSWGGVAVYRNTVDDPHPTVRGGDRSQCRLTDVVITPEGLIVPSRLEPRYLYVKAQQIRCHAFHATKGRKARVVRVKRYEDVPKGVTSWVEYQYVDFGILRWYVERKLTPEQLVECGVYRAGDANIPARGEYYSLLQVRTEEGAYYEPDASWVDACLRHHYEEESERLSDLKLSDREARERARADRDEREEREERAEFEQAVRDIEREPVGRTFFTPQPKG